VVGCAAQKPIAFGYVVVMIATNHGEDHLLVVVSLTTLCRTYAAKAIRSAQAMT
jgi:hypothetical protein